MRQPSVEEDEVSRRLADLADRLDELSGRRPGWVPSTENRDGGYPFFRLEDAVWSYAACERGREVFSRRTASRHELLGWIASDLARDVAMSDELEHRVEGPDTRRRWFATWERLTRALDPGWGQAVSDHQAEVLAQHPFRDGRA